MDYSCVTVPGKRVYNEDSCIVEAVADGILLAVADGLGGHAAGEVASGIAIDTLRSVFMTKYRTGAGILGAEALMRLAFEEADRIITSEAKDEREGMGTTLSAAFIIDGSVIVGNTGDSRVYLLDGSLRQITKDHSLVQELVDKGMVDAESARFHPMKHIIRHSLGGDFRVDIISDTLSPKITLLLSTDGLHDYIGADRIEEILKEGDACEAAKSLIDEALSSSDDNITAVVMRTD